MIERRSGVDLIRYIGGGWGVAFGGRLLSVHQDRGEALEAARMQGDRVRHDVRLAERRYESPRLRCARPAALQLVQPRESNDAA